MSINKKNAEQLQELKSTLVKNSHIKEVHFTEKGAHFFNKHELVVDNNPTGKFYGSLKTEPKLAKVSGERKFFKLVSIANPETEIVETLPREDVLNYELKIEPAEGETKKGKKTEPAEK